MCESCLGDAADCCREIPSILAPHTVVEEQGLFPEMTDDFPDHVEVLRSERGQLVAAPTTSA